MTSSTGAGGVGNGGVFLIVVIVLALVVILLSSSNKLLDKPTSTATSLKSDLSNTNLNFTATSSTSLTYNTNSKTSDNNNNNNNNNNNHDDDPATAPAINLPDTQKSASTSTTNPTTQFSAHLRFPPTVVGSAAGKEEIIDLKSQEGHPDAGFVCMSFSLPELLGDRYSADSHLIQMKPVVTEIEKYGSIVHHMDIFSCKGEAVKNEEMNLKTRSQQSTWCSHDQFLDTGSCRQLLWVYDRGAKIFNMPPEAGILVGPSSGFDHVLLQIHYLLPETYQIGIDTPLVDSSGFELKFDATLREHSSSLIGFLDFSINVPPHSSHYTFKNHIDSKSLANMVANDFLKYRYIQPFGLHLHAHNHAISVRLEHYRQDVQLATYDLINPFHGYGVDQTFHHLVGKNGKTVDRILPGDSLTFVCVFDTTNVNRATFYGVSHGDEMCAPILMYYPHVSGPAGYEDVNMISFDTSHYRDMDVNMADTMKYLQFVQKQRQKNIRGGEGE
jgi:hypothetical protein